MTSNVGARDIAQSTTLGFSPAGEGGLSDKEIKTRVMSELKKMFRPEFLNRLDEIIVFKSLTKEQIRMIVDLMIAELRDRLIEINRSIELTDEAKDFIADVGMDPTNGARPLRRAIQRRIEDQIAEDILAGKWPEGSIILVDVKEPEGDDGEKGLAFLLGSGDIPEPRKHESIASKTELIWNEEDLNDTGRALANSQNGNTSDTSDDDSDDDESADEE